jgi:hypothetical protein
MANEMRDRLVELMVEADAYDGYECILCTDDHSCFRCYFTKLADHLIENGVVVPPCKVGQIVYIINDFDTEEPYVLPVEVVELGQSKNGQWIALDLPLGLKISRYISWDNIGKDIFLTKAEAEQKLKEMRGADNG